MDGDRMRQKVCTACGGTGQLASFHGVSRFLLSWEECPQCGGTGYCTGEKPSRTERGGKAPAGTRRSERKKKRG